MSKLPVLIDGKWCAASAHDFFKSFNPSTAEALPDEYPISDGSDCDAVLSAAAAAAVELRRTPPARLALFLSKFAERIEARATELTQTAHLETALALTPRLMVVELPRTAGQLRQAAAAAIEGSWALPTIDSKLNICSCHAPIGPVCVFGPNNFPLAFNSVSGGDFAAAIAAGNPVIAKGHPSHPGTTRILAEEAFAAITDTQLPPASLQLLYHISAEDGLRLVADHRTGASSFTGSRTAGLALKAAADKAGKPIYLEMSSLNPVVILPGALQERAAQIADELAGSCLASGGQLCTKPGLVILIAGDKTESFLNELRLRFMAQEPSTLLSSHVCAGLTAATKKLRDAGAQIVAGGEMFVGAGGKANRFANTLLRVSSASFFQNSPSLQTEAFGNSVLAIIAGDVLEARRVLEAIEGQLTGCLCSAASGADDEACSILEPVLRRRVGRLLNDKMPTGVAVSPAMNHGGPFPSSGHPGFTSVGIPASMRRFSQLECYDNVRPSRLPLSLGDKNPNGSMWRLIDGTCSQADIQRNPPPKP